MGEINDDFSTTEVVLGIGANDTVNPGRRGGSLQPDRRHARPHRLGGRPGHRLQRSMASGSGGVQNPVFFRSNTSMLFGDPKDRVEGIVGGLWQTPVRGWMPPPMFLTDASAGRRTGWHVLDEDGDVLSSLGPPPHG